MVDDKIMDEVGKAMATHEQPKDAQCPRCGKILAIGYWPWCPHGQAHGGFKLKGDGWTPRG